MKVSVPYTELELELIQTEMTQKAVYCGHKCTRVRCAEVKKLKDNV